MPKQEYCVKCDQPTKGHCRVCGLPLCTSCGKYTTNICDACEEIREEDDDNAELRGTTSI